MFDVVNQFGIRLLVSLAQKQGARRACVSPPSLYLPLSLLKQVAKGATRVGLTRALGSEETLTDEEREARLRQLRALLSTPPLLFDATLQSRGQRPMLPAFLRRASELYGIPVQTDETLLPLRFQTRLNVAVSLTGERHQAQQGRLTGLRLAAEQGLALYYLLPQKSAFWQSRERPLQDLLTELNAESLSGWRTALAEGGPVTGKLPPLPALCESGDLLPRLGGLDLGPAITPAADFSLMMVAGEAPHLSSLRHTLQLRFSGEGLTATMPRGPLLWWLKHEESGLVLALGFEAEGSSSPAASQSGAHEPSPGRRVSQPHRS